MIIETAYKANDTVTIKSVAGEEIVARFVSEDDKSITVKKPMTIVATQQGMGLGPFAFSLDPEKDITLYKTGILMISKTEKDISSQYVQSSTGLTVSA